jgi:endonuclease-8
VPEGDSIARDAARLRPLLVGEALSDVRHRGARVRDLIGETIEAIDTRGKHLWLRLPAADAALHVHLGMEGRWTLLSPDGLARSPGRVASASLALINRRGGALCLRAPRVELVRGPDARDPSTRLGLGPDVLASPPDVEAMVARASEAANRQRPLGEVLLDQRVAAGIGNLWKSELCFDQQLDPRAPVAAFDAAPLRALFARAAQAMSKERMSSKVYRRDGRPCPRCGAPIVRVVQGTPPGRGTYLCPRCQASDHA